jgi:integrase
MRKPFFKPKLKCWYVRDGAGRDVRLDPDKKKAHDLWAARVASGVSSGPEATVLAICDKFVDAHEGDFTPARMADIARYLASFCSCYPGSVSKLTRQVVRKWLDEPKLGRIRKDGSRGPSKVWSTHAKRDAGSNLKRALQWAVNEGLIVRNPIAGLRLEEPKPRSILVDEDAHRAMVQDCLSGNSDRSFAMYLIASHCGARPQQIREVTAANFNGSAWIFSKHKTVKKTGKPLITYLHPCLQTLSKILSAANPKGPLFRNGRGEPWKKDTTAQRVRRLRDRLGLPEGVVLYSYRHSFATNALASGASVPTVSALMGHADLRMVSRVYGHVDQLQSHLMEASSQIAIARLSPQKPKS